MEAFNSKRVKLTWKLKGTRYNRLYFQLVPSTMPRTAGTAFGLLPTPRTTDVEGGAVKDVKTNDAGGYYRENKKGEKWGVKLRDVVESGLLATPTATDWKGAYSPEAMVSKDGIDRSLLLRNVYIHTDQDWKQEDGTTSQLSPYLWKK